MKSYSYDLHIHSVLSSCADVLMTPNNILNMANLKGLDFISVCDHNSLSQLPVLSEISASYPIIFIYGAELEIQDGSHILVYLKTMKDVEILSSRLDSVIDKSAPLTNHLHGGVLTDINDLEITTMSFNLSQSLPLSFDDLVALLEGTEYRLVLAHINRANNSAFGLLKHPSVSAVECTMSCADEWISTNIPSDLKVLFNSDAHEIVDISEVGKRNLIELKEKSIDAFFEALHRG